MKMISIVMCFFLHSCTLAFNNIHTQGSASDIVDEEQTPKNDLSIPLNIK